MKLTKQQQILLHGALFHCFSVKAFDPLDDYEELKELMNSLRDSLSTEVDENPDIEIEDEGESEESSHEADYPVLTKDDVASLSLVRCGLRGEKKQTLKFEYNGDYLDALVDDEVFENIDRIVRSAKSVDIREAGGSWSSFDVEKFPKSWTETLELDVIYSVED